MPDGIERATEDRNSAAARLPRRPHRAADRAELGFLVFLSAVLLGGIHGVVFAEGNFHEVVPGRVYRSSQPTPARLRAWTQRYGLKTIVNLRGETAPEVPEEEAAAASLGATMVHLNLSAHHLMSRRTLLKLLEVLDTARQPMLLHCYHGIDRAGTASALAAWFVGNQPYDRAKWQAYVPSGPWKHWKGSDHISDMLNLYEDYCRQHSVNPDDRALFRYWAAKVYTPRPPAREVDPSTNENAVQSCARTSAR